MVKLYGADLKAKNFYFKGRTFEEVEVSLFRSKTEGINYPEEVYKYLIQDFEGKDLDPQTKLMNKASVDENFTGEEIKKMTPYFESFTNTRFSYRLLKEGSIPHRCMPTGAIPVGGPYDFICFDQMKNYPLKVKVWGYFDVSDCKEVLVEEEFPERFRFWVSPILERKGHNLAARIITGKEKE